MTSIDVDFCKKLLKTVGTGLNEKCKREERSSSVTDLFNQFELSNDWATNQIKVAMAEKYPNIHWSGSEFETQNQQKVEFQGEYWICDAIDGAVQFLQGIYSYTISLCLVRDGQPVLSFVYDPSHDELFHAVAGEGAFLNGKRISVATKEKLGEAIVSTTPPSFPTKEIESTNLTLKGFGQIIPRAFAVRMLGSVSLQLAYTACGRLDGYYEFGDEFYNWIAGALLVQEAGGVVSDREGNSFRWGASGIIASNPVLHQKMKEELHAIYF
ncbi:inositol monophosphatase family protein [Aneurinibacillus migulanus]|uniref:inositol monophosphatase family protein n=1 Tax=Aneurinibacillus migulanus TaxID=47500 RepID=UPI00209FA46F|nr:inositol monophosphatase family protein [Aneurinibacillus migulanus]MCP1359268.1 inositol monophosphatase [Aneurinibacillus migulanus]